MADSGSFQDINRGLTHNDQQRRPQVDEVTLVSRKRSVDDMEDSVGDDTPSADRGGKRQCVYYAESYTSTESGSCRTLSDHDDASPVANRERLGAANVAEPEYSEVEDEWAKVDTSYEPSALQQAIEPNAVRLLGVIGLPRTEEFFGRRDLSINAQVGVGFTWESEEEDQDDSEESWADVEEQTANYLDFTNGVSQEDELWGYNCEEDEGEAEDEEFPKNNYLGDAGDEDEEEEEEDGYKDEVIPNEADDELLDYQEEDDYDDDDDDYDDDD